MDEDLRFTRLSVLVSVLMVGCSLGFMATRSDSEDRGVLQGQVAECNAPTSALRIYKQWDPRWADARMLPSSATMRSYGCLVCCVAMIYTHYGIETTPGQLNAYLGVNSGFTRRGLLKWKECAAYTQGRARIEYIGDADLARLNREIDAGNPVIVKVKLGSGVDHWVLVVGCRGGDYLVADPLGSEMHPVPLARFGNAIQALRVFRKVGN